MGTQRHSVTIRASIEDVHAYASTVTCWPEWHPSSLRIFDAAARPLHAGETFEEDIHAAGRDAHLRWRVLVNDAPSLWSAEASADSGVDLTIEYRLQPAPDGVTFERVLNYRLRSGWLILLDPLILRRRIDAESALSLRQLKQVMEGDRPSSWRAAAAAAASG